MSEPKTKLVFKKATKAKERKGIIELLQSGYAGINEKGKIVDRRSTKVLKAFAEEPLLSIPKPKEI